MIPVLVIEISSIIFGLTALLLASRARKRLSPGSIRMYIDNFSVCLVFVVVFSLWRAIRDIIDVKYGVGDVIQSPEMIFIVCAYIAFVIASYRVVHISHEFGFKKEGEEIGTIISSKKLKNSSVQKRKV